MKVLKLLALLFVLIQSIGCSSGLTEADIKDAVLGKNYFLVSNQKDTVRLEFLDSCARDFTWTKSLILDWSAEVADGKVVLDFDVQNFEPKKLDGGGLEFVNAKNGDRLVQANDADFSLEALAGEWSDLQYINFKKGISRGLTAPECPDMPKDSFYIPTYRFVDGKCSGKGICKEFETNYSVNKTFKSLIIGDGCTPEQIWKIREITPTQMVVDVRKIGEEKVSYEFNKILLKTAN